MRNVEIFLDDLKRNSPLESVCVKSVLSQQREALECFYTMLDVEKAEAFLQQMVCCEGLFCFTGVGKSGYIAQKIVATLLSMGIKAFYLAPLDGLHGDVGVLSSKDLLICLSKSGQTEELLDLIHAARAKGTRVGVLTGNGRSPLASEADFFLELPTPKELGPFELAPTTSTEIQLLIGDALAIGLIQARQIDLETFAKNHPGGQIGKRLRLKVRDLMLPPPQTPLCSPDHLLGEVLADFSAKHCGCMVVVNEKSELKGIFTDGDLRRAFTAKGEGVLKEKLSALMNSTPKSIAADALAWEAMRLMEADRGHPFTVLPVKEGDKVVGLIKMHDILQAGL